MKWSASVAAAATRFDRLSLRERALLVAALLAALLTLWDSLLIQPLELKRKALSAQLETLQSTIDATATAMASAVANDPGRQALHQIDSSQQALKQINQELASSTIGLLPPERMAAVLQDVLRHRPQVTLLSLRTEPVVSLLLPADEHTGPYLHPVELVIAGRYLDVLDYLRSLEALRWRFYWKSLELDSSGYPIDRARIELGTLSLDPSWMGL